MDIHTLQHRVMDQAGSIKSMASERVRTLRGDVKSNPVKWAGIAAGAGMVVGLAGRYLKWRAERPIAQLVVIDAC